MSCSWSEAGYVWDWTPLGLPAQPRACTGGCDTALQPRGALGSIICKLRRVYILSYHCNSFKRRHWNLSDQKTLKSALCFPTTGSNGSTGLDPIIQALKIPFRASLVAQWLRICLPMQGTQVRALVWEDPTCRGATGPVSHNY